MQWLGLALLLFQVSVHAASETIERVEWKKIPIRLELKVGEERRIEFPDSVKVGLPSNLQPMLRTQSVNRVVYLMAHETFESTRVLVRETHGDHIYLFDIVASKESSENHPLQVFIKKEGGSNKGDDWVENGPTLPEIGYVTLIRFAAQQLYAPARLLRNNPGIVRTSVGRDPIDLVRGSAINARPLVAWRAGGYYLTAVKLTNRTKQPQAMDPRDLRGAWLAATFQHHRLLPEGDEADTTAVYLISARPFSVSF
ncbi:MAG: TIGR03749 family integrating conjugative element protein [Gammaproteobacteria bacterium]|nr:TIGR03749 family integrating conjugative element protein [Gammaproteobacteria bacterium]